MRDGDGSIVGIWRWGTGVRGGVALVLLCLAVYVPGLFAIPPIDRDESRFAQASRQMFESVALPVAKRDPVMHSGGLVVPMVQGRARLNKPPLVYWLQAASAWVFTGGEPLRDSIWMYRVPGVLCAIGTVLMTWRLGRSMFDGRAAWLGAALLGVCPLVVIDAHQARADQLLLLTVTGAQWALWSVWRGRGRQENGGRWWVFWFFLAIGILAKGPIAPMIAALTCLFLSVAGRDWRWLKRLHPVAGLVIVGACVGPWVYAVGERVGWSEYLAVVYNETVGRSVEAREGHWGPPGYHTVLLAVLFWPGSLLTLMAVGRAIARGLPVRWDAASRISRLRWITRRYPGRRAELFCLAWILPAWVVFELIGTKLPHYTMPMYPALALLSARAVLAAGRLGLVGGRRVATLVPWLLIGTVLCVVLPMTPWFIGVRLSPWTIPLGVLWVFGMVLAFVLLIGRGEGPTRREWAQAQCAGVVAITVTMIFLWQGLLPWTKRLWPSARVMELLGPIDRDSSRPIAGAGYGEDSLVFLTRGRLERIEPGDVYRWLDSHELGVAVVGATPPPDLERVRVLADLWGYNYSTGKRVDLLIVEKAR